MCDANEYMHPAALEEEALLRQCRVRREKRSGPGGQHRNKVETAVVVIHAPTKLRGQASERRSQEENRRRAIFRLRMQLAIHLRCGPPSTRTELWDSRCRHGRIQVSASHGDYPALLAEAMDVIAQCDFEMKKSAAALLCTTSQLVKFLQLAQEAIVEVNRGRNELGYGALR